MREDARAALCAHVCMCELVAEIARESLKTGPKKEGGAGGVNLTHVFSDVIETYRFADIHTFTHTHAHAHAHAHAQTHTQLVYTHTYVNTIHIDINTPHTHKNINTNTHTNTHT